MVNEEKKKSLLEAQIEKKSQSCDENRDLWNTAQNIVSDVKKHLKRISSQMPNYDIHDEEHSQEIIKIMEGILAYKLKDLSFYELILLYLAAYLHDSGMALPDWEYETLKIVEECDKYSPSTSQHKLKSYFQSSKKPDIAKKILKHLNFKYKDHESYIFIEDSEEKVVENISDLIGEYESFRYEEIAKRNNTSYEDYKKLSEDIRYEFIRTKHHKKAANNIENLNNKIKDDIGSFTKDFLKDLADICQAHCENIERVKELPTSNRTDWDSNDKNNIQFLAEMLRLGDIIHFSSDRAPRSLFSEKLITDERSIKHWKAKEGVKCLILPGKDLVKISFHASCSKPEMYYFLADYIKEIESEISNFDELKKDWEIGNKYNVNIYRKVKNKIECSGFKPDSKLKFTMDQSKILELLMGVQLYNDNFACLREVYQNALDTSKCLLAYNKKRGVSEEINIEFGIGEEELEGRNRKFIYCCDKGLGMNKEIIKKYLLHIGNSYYNSTDFNAKKVDWENNVTPTSQFGIGILSCYMIADKIGISTKYYDKGEKISCVLSGISERFYYIDMSRTDEEKIGNHGTIVKLYLKDEYAESINSDSIPEMPLIFMLDDTKDKYIKEKNEEYVAILGDVKKIKNNLSYILFQYVGIQHLDIPVRITGDKTPLCQYNQIFEPENFVEGIEKIRKLHDKLTTNSTIRFLEKFFSFVGNLVNYAAKTANTNDYIVTTNLYNVTLYTLLSLPKKGVTKLDLDLYVIRSNFIGNKQVEYLCVDGITVEKPNDIDEYLGFYENCLSHTLINFTGEKRPLLSIDRTKCVGFNTKFSEEESNQLKEEFLSKMLEQIKSHMEDERINLTDKECSLIYDCVCHYTNLSVALKLLMKTYLTSSDKNMFLYYDDSNYLKMKDVDSNQLIINNIDFRKCKYVSKGLIFDKCASSKSISVSDNNLIIADSNSMLHNIILSPDYIPLLYSLKGINRQSVVIRANEWKGKYKEYDMVTSIWPIINPNLFNKLTWKSTNIPHCKGSNSRHIYDIETIANLDHTHIRSQHIITNDSEIKQHFKLTELPNYENTEYSTLFAYIAPRKLNNSEEAELKEYEQKDPDYFEGVKNGWSIYFLPTKGYIIRSGIRSRKEMEDLVREQYEGKTEDITYVNTNDEIVIQGENGDEK